MKSILFLFFSIFTSVYLNAQAVVELSKTEKTKQNGIEITTYKGKSFSGYLVESYLNGKPKTWITMKNGLANGLWQEWLENGNLRYNATWKDGKGHGLWKYFHDNGVLKYEESYILDIPNGISRTYYNNGNLQNDFFFLNGKKQGTWSYYSETGILLKQEVYENNELISTTDKNKLSIE